MKRSISLLMALCTFASAACAQEAEETSAGDSAFHLPVYPDAAAPPPRTEVEVAELLAGADPVAAKEDADQRPLRIVLVAGPKDHGVGEHDYPAWQQVWRRLLGQAANTEVDTAWEFPSPQQITWADVLVFYQRGSWNDDRAMAIDPFLARGGGAVYIHWAVEGQAGHADFAKRIGLASLGGSIRYRHGALKVDLSPGKSHPIARNFHQIELHDESYWKLTGDPTQLNLIGTSTEEDAPRPIFWTVERGRGRVFVSIPGHYMWTFDDPAFRTLLLRGIAWSARRDVDRFNFLVRLDARVTARSDISLP